MHQHIQGHLIAAAFGNDQVGLALRRFHKLLVHGLHRGEVLVDHAVQRAAAALYVPQNAAKDAHIGVRVHKHLDVQLFAQLRHGKQQNALHDHHRGRVNANGAVAAVVRPVIVHRTLNGMPGPKLL